jgi:uncharacterized membrane protein
MMRTLSRYFLTGLLVLVPTWATFLILSALLTALNRAISDFLGQVGVMYSWSWLAGPSAPTCWAAG